MGTPYMSEIKIVTFGFPPKGWAQCDGQLLPINQNQALFSLLGTTYGGDGRVNFGLPDLRGRTPMHTGNGHVLGERGGQDFHTLTQSELPQHIHQLQARKESAPASAGASLPTGKMFAEGLVSLQGGGTTTAEFYANPLTNATSLHSSTVANVGGSQPHENRMPFLALNFCIALQGVFPSQN
jgi:microcystin-dependent protein